MIVDSFLFNQQPWFNQGRTKVVHVTAWFLRHSVENYRVVKSATVEICCVQPYIF